MLVFYFCNNEHSLYTYIFSQGKSAILWYCSANCINCIVVFCIQCLLLSNSVLVEGKSIDCFRWYDGVFSELCLNNISNILIWFLIITKFHRVNCFCKSNLISLFSLCSKNLCYLYSPIGYIVFIWVLVYRVDRDTLFYSRW